MPKPSKKRSLKSDDVPQSSSAQSSKRRKRKTTDVASVQFAQHLNQNKQYLANVKRSKEIWKVFTWVKWYSSDSCRRVSALKLASKVNIRQLALKVIRYKKKPRKEVFSKKKVIPLVSRTRRKTTVIDYDLLLWDKLTPNAIASLGVDVVEFDSRGHFVCLRRDLDHTRRRTSFELINEETSEKEMAKVVCLGINGLNIVVCSGSNYPLTPICNSRPSSVFPYGHAIMPALFRRMWSGLPSFLYSSANWSTSVNQQHM